MKSMKNNKICDVRESNPGQLLGRQLCSPLYQHRIDKHEQHFIQYCATIQRCVHVRYLYTAKFTFRFHVIKSKTVWLNISEICYDIRHIFIQSYTTFELINPQSLTEIMWADNPWALSAHSITADNCGYPTPVFFLVVQTDPGPMPT